MPHKLRIAWPDHPRPPTPWFARGPHVNFDPWTFSVILATWCFINGTSFMLSRNLQSRPGLLLISHFGLSNTTIGAAFFVDASLLVWGLRLKLWVKSWIALMTSALLAFFGVEVMRGAWLIQTFSTTAAAHICLACGCWYATLQWAAKEDYSDVVH